jgi:hypothetical protein
MDLKTIYGRAFGSIFEILRTPFGDIDMKFNENGLEILLIDGTETMIVHLQIDKDKLAHYEIGDKNYKFSINTKQLAIQLRSLSDDDILQIAIDENKENELQINFYAGENAGAPKRISTLPLYVRKSDDAVIPEQEFGWELIVPRKSFQNWIQGHDFGDESTISVGRFIDDTEEDEKKKEKYCFSIATKDLDGSSEIFEMMQDMTNPEVSNQNEVPNPPEIKILKKTGEFICNKFEKRYLYSIAKGQHINDTFRLETGLSPQAYEVYQKEMNEYQNSLETEHPLEPPAKPDELPMIRCTYDVKGIGFLSIYLLGKTPDE